MRHKYDKRGAGEEGELAENLFREVCDLHKQNFLGSSIKEDCAGVDGYLDGRPIDVKARKNRMPANTCWVEVAKAGGVVGTGWAYSNKYIAQQMVYEEDNKIIKMQYGIYHAPDVVKLMNKKVNFDTKASKGTIYELYTRWWDGQHRGAMTVLPYSDLESLVSFQTLVVPETLWGRVWAFYKYN